MSRLHPQGSVSAPVPALSAIPAGVQSCACLQYSTTRSCSSWPTQLQSASSLLQQVLAGGHKRLCQLGQEDLPGRSASSQAPERFPSSLHTRARACEDVTSPGTRCLSQVRGCTWRTHAAAGLASSCFKKSSPSSSACWLLTSGVQVFACSPAAIIACTVCRSGQSPAMHRVHSPKRSTMSAGKSS